MGNAKIMYGSFLQNVVDFLIIALSLFTVIKVINKFKKKQEKKETVVVKSEEVLLLSEIRDLLKKEEKPKKASKKVTKK